MNRPLLIVNPKAGLGLYQRHIPVVVNRLSAAGIVPAVYITQSTGDAKRIAMEKAEEYDAVICYGGDGTLNEVVSGVLESGTGRTIGYIPAGSTNDYAYSLKLPADMKDRLFMSPLSARSHLFPIRPIKSQKTYSAMPPISWRGSAPSWTFHRCI